MSNSTESDMIEAPDFDAAHDKSGRAVWDDQGNSTWEWQTQPGVYSAEIDTQQLRQLVSAQLELLENSSKGISERIESKGCELAQHYSAVARHTTAPTAVIAAAYDPSARRKAY
jgi:serine phosphatase RsbU (regulator of sigma subunit)